MSCPSWATTRTDRSPGCENGGRLLQLRCRARLLVRRCLSMRTVIQVSPRDSAKAWALLVRHSPGVALPDHAFIVSEEAVRALQNAGIHFSVLSREASMSGATV